MRSKAKYAEYKIHVDDDEGAGNNITNLQKKLDAVYDIPIELLVAHFTPSSFPVIPVINKATAKTCGDSWRIIVNSTAEGSQTSGITAFYNLFYDRLEIFDTEGRFEAVLSRHSSAQNKIAAKGGILIRIVQFVLKIEGDSTKVQTSLYMLGKSHSQKGIRPWQYSVFVQTLLMTIASRLGSDATSDVMESWVNLFAFVMKSMLPQAIKGQVVATELNINTSNVFNDEKINDQVKGIEEKKEKQKKYGVGSASGTNSGALADVSESIKT